MNNQIPYGYMPPFNNGNCNCNRNETKMLNDKVELLEKQLKKLDKRVTNLENNSYYPRPMPYSSNDNNYPNNNYMI